MANDSTCHNVRAVHRQTLRAREIINWVRCSSSSPVHLCTERAMGSGVLSIPRCSKLQKAHSSVIQTSAPHQRSKFESRTLRRVRNLWTFRSNLFRGEWKHREEIVMLVSSTQCSQKCVKPSNPHLLARWAMGNVSQSESRPVLSDIKRGCNETPEVGVFDFISRRPEFYSWDKMSRIHRVTCQTSTEH